MKRRPFAALLICIGLGASIHALGEPSSKKVTTGTIKGVLKVKKGKETVRTEAVVYLVENEEHSRKRKLKKRRKARRSQTIAQERKQFTRRWLAVTKGTKVEFPNLDDRVHNVFSNSRKNTFDLGRFRPGKTESRKLTHEGVVDVYCDIHPEMSATILVLPHDYWANTDENGNYKIPNVPPGTYTLKAWHHDQEASKTVTVEAGGTTTVDLQLKEGEPPGKHLRKDGTPYPRDYKEFD